MDSGNRQQVYDDDVAKLPQATIDDPDSELFVLWARMFAQLELVSTEVEIVRDIADQLLQKQTVSTMNS
jgi:hypothetical protein